MGSFFDQIIQHFKQKDLLIKIILINVVVFIITAIIGVISTLFKLEGIYLTEYIGVPSNILVLVWRLWTLITYMFVHDGILHIFFNMLMLYWFGQMFQAYFNSKTLVSLYIIGGIAGALLYIIAFNTIPYYLDMRHSILVGASASVMAIIFAAASYRPNEEVRLIFIGNVKIIYIAIFLFVLDFIALGSKTNPGGHMAHIGGAIAGYLFAKQMLKGKDITRWLTRIIDSINNLFKPRKKKKRMNVKFQKREEDYEYNQRKHSQQEQIDLILDKIKESGYASLSSNEKKQLFDASKK